MKGSKEEIKAIDLRSDYKVNPIGIHNVAPRLSWRMTAYGKNRKQSAYQIQVFKKESDIKEVLVWDSEKVYSGESVNIPYKGKQLASRERVYWKVRIWDEKENVSEWSEEAFFEAGLLNKTDWEAEWICAPEKAAAVYFRKVCNIEKQPKSGRLYISGLGYYEAYLNGKKCGEDVLTPNRTHYTERVFYHTYDITTAVVHGENVFGVELGNGWYNQKDKINEKKLWYGYPKLLFQIEIEYADGDKDVFISDENTKWHESPRIYNNIYFGEIYDARKESIGWREKDFEDLDWKFAGKAEKPGGELTKQKAPSDQKICELFPKKISEVTPGMYVIDFGQNMTGWVKMRVSGKEGDKVQLRFGEELWPDGKINYYSTGSGWKQQKDIYILSGKKEEYYEPAFTWHGFRYVEVQGYPGIPKREDFVAVHIRAGVERSGKFICSNALINQIQKASLWSMESGLHGGIPLDSPHRERQGYGGDALITAKAMMYSYDMHEFYSESLKPDIILTDICMPDIDGLTFAEKIKGRNPDTKVIAITGYDNFEYAKRGICIGLDGYILKPINEEELTECIVKIKKKILEENRKRNEIETLSIFKREAEEIVKNYYLTKLLESDVPEKIVNSQLMEELALETSPMVWIVVFQWKTNLIAKRTGNEELLDCEMWIVNYCKEKLKKMVWVHGTANRLIILDPEKDIMPETILKQLQEEWKKEFECPLYYGTEVIYNQEKSIHEGYIEAVNQLNIELVNGENKPEDIWRWKQQKKETKQLWDLNELKRLQYCVEAEDLEEVEKVIDSYFLKWKDVTLDDMELLQVQLLNIYFYFYTSFGDRCIDAVAMQYMNFYENVKHAENILELKNAFLIGCQALQEMLRGRETAADSYKLIYSMKQYIKENLDDPDFSLGALAKAYYMNSSYLSRFFKEKVKSSFVEYLTEQRIDKAKQLLQYGNFKIYEVGEKVGIYNANYFGILFKKKVGVTPAEYRKQYEK